MNDMIGSEGPLRSWTVLWHMEFIWLLPVLLVSVILVAAVEMLISNWRMRRSSVRPLSVGVRTPLGSAEPSPPRNHAGLPLRRHASHRARQDSQNAITVGGGTRPMTPAILTG